MMGVNQFWDICILVLGLLNLSQSTITPRTSFLTGSPGRALSHFTDSEAPNATTLLLSADADTLFVGGRDSVLSVDVSQSDGITLKNKFNWALRNHVCDSGESNKNCANIIRILQFINSTHLYVCGSGAFKPTYTILTADSLKVSRNPEHVKGHCPYNGSERSTALIVDGQLYTTTTNDYFGNHPVISRYFSNDGYNLQLSEDHSIHKHAKFISSSYIPSEGKVLFFFNEEGNEYNFMNKFTVSRVAQVCTDDRGGKRVLQKRWTSFAKSQLICQTEQQLPFGLLQDIVMVPAADDRSPDDALFYGIFTSQWALASGRSAVCSFTLADIKAAFSGNYKTYDEKTSLWKENPNTKGKLGKCGLHKDSDSILNLVKKTFLTAKNVQAVGHKQILTSKEELYSHITAQRAQAANGHMYTILYLLSETGYLHKVVLLKDTYHIVEAIQVFKQPQTIVSILLSITKGVVFVGSSEGVMRVPVSNCSFYSSCAECVLAQDPFCGWDSDRKDCVPVSSMNSKLYQDIENGNVTEQCKGTVVPKVLHVHLYQSVMLPCASSWRFSNHCIVPQLPYMQQREDNLHILVIPNTPKELHCVSEKQTLAIFLLKVQGSLPHSGNSVDLNASGNGPPKNYFNEMVAVSVLFALCLCALVGGSVWWWRRSQNTNKIL